MEEEQIQPGAAEATPAPAEVQTGDLTVLYTGNADTLITRAGGRVITFDRAEGHTAKVSLQELDQLLSQPELEHHLTKLN